jgi:hypothetical protein
MPGAGGRWDRSLQGSLTRHHHPPPPRPRTPSSTGLGRADAAAGEGLAGCLPGLVCQQGGGWQL